MLGFSISDKSDFNFSRINSYSGELVWLPKNVPAGVYLIMVKVGDTNKSTLVLIE